MAKRVVDLVVLSDVHLGSRGSRAEELTQYLKSIRPKTLVLNGDIIDFWQFSKRYWPKSHSRVLKQILHIASKGSRVVYLTGNHDERLRRFADLEMGNLELRNSLVLDLPCAAGAPKPKERIWLFHGDVFDAVMGHSKWLAKIGAIGYDALISLNVAINTLRRVLGFDRVSLSKRVKNKVKSAVSFINNFEETAAQFAFQRGFDSLVCGHIHQPADRLISFGDQAKVRYLNAGDWVENLSALERHNGEWRIYHHEEAVGEDAFETAENQEEEASFLDVEMELTQQALLAGMLAELEIA